MRVLRLILPLALVLAALALAGGAEVAARLGRAEPLWLAGSAALLALVTVLSGLRWRMTAGALGLPMTRTHAIREYFLAQFVNQTLPGGVLGDAARAMRSRQGGSLTPAAQAVVLERAAGQIAMALVMAAGAAATLPARPVPPAVAALALALPLGIVAGLALPALRAKGSWGRAIRAGLVRLWPRQAALSLAIAVLTVAAFALAARATGTRLDPGPAALAIPLILTAMLLPASVGGWGWREGAAAALFPLAGADAAQGLAASLGFGLAALAAALPGAAFVLARPAREAAIAAPPN